MIKLSDKRNIVWKEIMMLSDKEFCEKYNINFEVFINFFIFYY